MLQTDRLVVVEGKYDKIKLERVLDAMIITTDGFSIFKDKPKAQFIREYAAKKGVLILTDSDAAGFKIRNYLQGSIPAEQIMNAYIPDIIGKEKRKTVFSKEGKLGVEGISDNVLIEVLQKAGIEEQNKVVENHIKSYDLYSLGLYGQIFSKQYRQKLIGYLNLPERISKNNLLNYLNRNYSKEEFINIIKHMEEDNV